MKSLVGILFVVVSGLVGAADEGAPAVGEGLLLGNAGGARSSLSAWGAEIGLGYSADFFRVMSGGLAQETNYLGKGAFSWDQNWEKAVGWSGASTRVSLFGVHGKGPSGLAGDYQWTSNIEAFPTIKVYEAWLQQSFSGGSISALAGLFEFNNEFYVSNAALAFLNSSFGLGSELAQSPDNGSIAPSTYPTTAVGFRLRVSPNPEVYLQTALLDGIPGDPNEPYGTHVFLNQEDGLLSVTEAGYEPGKKDGEDAGTGKYALGFWMYTQAVDTLLSGTSGDKRTSYGFYSLAEHNLFAKLSAFARFGVAAAEVNTLRYNLAAGLVYNGLLSLWDNDQLGVGFTRVAVSREAKELAVQNGNALDDHETAVEVFYRFEPLPGFSLQPDFQYVINPSADPSVSDAVVLGLRMDVLL